MAIKLKKTLYVGIGGTGVASLLKIKKCFIDSYGEIPPMIGFLAIDTDLCANNKSATSNRGEEIKLDKTELLICTVKGALNVYLNHSKTYDWVPTQNIDNLSTIQGFGAGQVRSNGRFIAYYNNQHIKTAVQSAVAKIHQLMPHDSIYETDINRDGEEYPTNINVIASVAGGSGSGMLIDVLCIIKEALKQKSIENNVYPWIVLPEIFKAMDNGPQMANVLYNSYGAIRELDYIEHHSSNSPAINFGYSKIDSSLFNYAYIINNMNQSGVSFNDLNDLTDVIAKSAFLPANRMGDDLTSPFDNIYNHKIHHTYDILNKKAWAASVGSAELLYDSQAVGRAIAYTTISQLCISMLQSPTDGTSDANTFVDDQHVMIRENNGRDDVINALLSPAPIYYLQIDENTTEFDINSYISNNCDQQQLEPSLKEVLNRKLSNTNQRFESYISNIMSRPQGKVDAAIKFIQALSEIISICKNEMYKECEQYQEKNSVPQQWNTKLNNITNTGIIKILKPIDEEKKDILQNELAETVTNKREEIRRQWAIRFYSEFEQFINEKLIKIQGLKTILTEISNKNCLRLLEEQHKANSISKFQVFLHQKDVIDASNYSIDDNVKTTFIKYIKESVSSWIGQSQEVIELILWDFAKDTPKVKEAVNSTIDNILKGMSEDDVKSYLSHLKILASPLWTYNTFGFDDARFEFDRHFIIGVGNRDNSILKLQDTYSTFFDSNGNKASFASTNQHDRIYILVIEDLLPIYAVNNFSSYEKDHIDKTSRGFMLANYLDEKLNNRIESENFSIMPIIETDNVLQYWVWGFVFDYIHYDETDNQYWIRSRKRGDALRRYRFNLGHQRDVAFDIFKSEYLYRELEEVLDNEIARNGRQPIEDKIAQIKREETYLEEYAHLSPLEQSNLNEPKFKAVRDLITQEIGLMTY